MSKNKFDDMSNTKSFVIMIIVFVIVYFFMGAFFQYFFGKSLAEIVAEFLQNTF